MAANANADVFNESLSLSITAGITTEEKNNHPELDDAAFKLNLQDCNTKLAGLPQPTEEELCIQIWKEKNQI